MTRRKSGIPGLVLLSCALAACESGPASPTAGLALVLPDGVTGRIVTCTICTTEPAAWGVVEQDVTIVNRSTRDRDVGTVEARAFNRTRGALISANTRPNATYSYPATWVPAGGALTLRAGLVYEPLPPPRDEVHLVVTVTFRDGASVRAETRLFTGG